MASLRHTRAMKCYQVLQEKQWIIMNPWHINDACHIELGLTKPISMSISDLSGSLRHHCSFEVLEILIASTPQPSLYLLLKHVMNTCNNYLFLNVCIKITSWHIVTLQWHHWFGVFSYWRFWGCSYHLWSCWSMIQMGGEQSVISQTFHRYSEHLSCTSSLIYKFYISFANVASIALALCQTL